MQTEVAEELRTYCFGEGRTKTGQLVKFTCAPGKEPEIREFLRKHVRDVELPTTQLNICHGGFGQYTRYDITQHDYAGGGNGYIEVLEIRDPPDGRWGVVINEWNSHHGSTFTEWKTVANARHAFANLWSRANVAGWSAYPGFKRCVAGGRLTPWFYAIGDEELVGDYAFPEGLQDDPVYRFGRQFVVYDEKSGLPSIKTCMGTRSFETKEGIYPYRTAINRVVYWQDGSTWGEKQSLTTPPRVLQDGEFWITEAIQEFHRLLSGEVKEFSINFLDGNKFVGKLVQPKSRLACAAGDYLLVTNAKGDTKNPRRGWVHDFSPTPEAPDIVSYATQRLKREGFEVERVEIEKTRIEPGGKKWAGVFFKPPSMAGS